MPTVSTKVLARIDYYDKNSEGMERRELHEYVTTVQGGTRTGKSGPSALVS